MSALGDYIHLRKYNYNKYGLKKISVHDEKEGEKGLVIDKQAQYWQDKMFEIRQRFSLEASKPDPIEQILQADMAGLQDYMKMLEEMENEEGNTTTEKGKILQETLGNTWKDLLKTISVSMATGQVSLGGISGDSSVNNFLLSNDRETIKRLATNVQRMYLGSSNGSRIPIDENGYAKVKDFLQQSVNNCQEFLDIITQIAITKRQITKLKSTFKKIQTKIDHAQKVLNEQLTKKEQWDYVIDKPLFQVKYGTGGSYISLNKNGTYGLVAKELAEALSALKVPDIAKIKGDLFENLAMSYYKQGRQIALGEVKGSIELACQKNGSTQTETSIKASFDPALETYLQTRDENGKKFLDVSNITSGKGQDKVTEAIMEYKTSSQRKADVRLTVMVEENNEMRIKNIGLSLKNYNKSTRDIHLVNDSSLYTFLLGGLNQDRGFKMDEINHLLNIFANDYNLNNNSYSSHLASARAAAGTTLEFSILYAALTGKNVGKGEENYADYMLLNISNDSQPIIVNVNKIIYKAILNFGKGVRINANGKALKNLILNNAKVPVESGGANKRIAEILNQLHQIKISASVPMTTAISAAKMNT